MATTQEYFDTRAYTVPEAAEQLSISRAKLYQLVADGTVASVKIGKNRRIRASALAAYLDRLERPEVHDVDDLVVQVLDLVHGSLGFDLCASSSWVSEGPNAPYWELTFTALVSPERLK